MIEWLALLLNTLWVLGLAIVLAAISYYSCLANRDDRSLRQSLRYPSFFLVFAAGVGLFCLGMAGSGRIWWERVLWSVLALVFAFQGWQQYKTLGISRNRLDKGDLDGTS